jgi:hypothetical protein
MWTLLSLVVSWCCHLTKTAYAKGWAVGSVKSAM